MNKVGIALIAASLPLAAGQQSLPQLPTFRSTADIVEVDVVVQDQTGRFITDLKMEDFEVREEGNQQKLDLFYVVHGGDITAPSSVGTDPGRNRSGAGSGPTPGTRAPRIFVAFFDDVHLTPGGFKRVQAAALTLFDKRFRDGDVGGVVVSGKMASNRLTTVREELVKAVRDAKPNSRTDSRRFDERTWPPLNDVQAIRIVVNDDRAILSEAVARACADEPSLCPNAELAVRSKAAQLANEVRATTAQTMQSVIALMNGLARIDGPKTVLLLSEGFLAQESWPLVKDAIGQAARANARIYVLDARGLDRTGVSSYLSGERTADEAMSAVLKQFDMAADSVNSLAIDTGGFVVRNVNFFEHAIGQIVDAAGTYYVLGYRPDKTPDGRFRRLAVKVNRQGAVVRARRGYLATPRPTVTPTASARPDELGPVAPATAVADGLVEGRAAREPAATATEAAATATVVPRTRPDATKHIETLAPTRSGDADVDAAAGWEAYQRGDLEAARVLLSSAAAHRAAHPWVFYALGQSQYALRQYSDAAGAWEQVRTTTPEFKPVYFDLVDAYLQLKEYDKATRVLRDGARRWPRDAELLNALGVVQVTRGALDDAVQSFERAVASDPADAVGYFNLAKTVELRYWKYRRFVSQTRQWIANGNDRNKAIDNYKRYLELGGPLENSAREGLNRLNWTNQ